MAWKVRIDSVVTKVQEQQADGSLVPRDLLATEGNVSMRFTYWDDADPATQYQSSWTGAASTPKATIQQAIYGIVQRTRDAKTNVVSQLMALEGKTLIVP